MTKKVRVSAETLPELRDFLRRRRRRTWVAGPSR